ncbi:MAG: protein kinase [Chloroflexota bacterium]
MGRAQLKSQADKFGQILGQIGAEQGYLLSLSADSGFTFQLKLKADSSPIETEDDLIVSAIIDRVLERSQPLIIRNAMIDSQLADDWDVMRLQVRSVMCVPLWDEDRIVQLAYVENRSERGVFNADQVALLVGLGKEQISKEQLTIEQTVPIPQREPSKNLPQLPSLPQSPNPRYILHEIIGQGGMGVVHRATDRLTGELVALKQIHLPAEKQAALSQVTMTKRNLRVALAQEFQIVAGMRHPHIISVLDYGFGSDQQPYFAMTYLPDAQPFLQAGQALNETDKLRILCEVLQALAYLHRRGIIHRDLKPSNILVTEGQVKVLDFGLSVSHETTTSPTGGTLLYMAPELFDKAPSSPASDLYAVGVMAYELFAGHHPFNVSSPKFVDQVIDQPPDLSKLTVPESLVQVIGCLLAKNPDNRYQQASDCLAAMNDALNPSVPSESEAIRESFLQAATFVGRDEEMARLKAALTQAKAGQGSVWLIGGESGVGKSRLMDEFRIQALVASWQVLRGQAVAEGGVPYQLWQDIVPHLVLNTDLSDLEAGVLKQMMPSISRMFDRPIPEPPQLQGEAAQQRLISTLLTVLKRQNQPTLLLLEDLQWAKESLAPLRQILKSSSQLSGLMVVATYRQDEVSDLPETLSGTKVLKLTRLADNQIKTLSQAMLGDVANNPHIISLLTQETEGNTFFIVEVMRALAEEAGQLDLIGQTTLPTGILTSGMQHLLQRRIAKVSMDGQGLLRLAAVVGRRIDLDLLASLASEVSLDYWLQQAAEASILDIQEGQWMFAHDKLRETILADLADGQRKTLHRQVAEAIEQVYPEHEAYHQTLLEHWYQAEDLDKEIHYLNLVAKYLISLRIDYSQADYLLQRSLKNLSETDSRRIPLLNWLARMYTDEGNFAQAQEFALQAKNLAEQTEDQYDVAIILRNLGWTLFRPGEIAPARALLEEGLNILETLDALDDLTENLNLLGNVTRWQEDHEQSLMYFQRSTDILQAIDEEIRTDIQRRTLGFSLMGTGHASYARGEPEKALVIYQHSLAMFEVSGNRSGMAISLKCVGFVQLDIHPELAPDTFQRALSVVQTIPQTLEIVMGFAFYYLQKDELIRAVTLCSLAQHHPARTQEVIARLDVLLPLLQAKLSSADLEAAFAQGQALAVDTVVAELLAGFFSPF